MKALEEAITAAVAGDLDALPTIESASQSDLLQAASNLHPLTLTKSALIRVLKGWPSGADADENVQRWASFVRRGYVAGRRDDPVQSIDIEYDQSDEDLIVEIIGRFDELGDVVDGEIDDAEKQSMMNALAGSRPRD
jgi:hypothetical protein